MRPIFVDTAGAKQALCCKTTKLYELINAGEIERVKLGAKTLITIESIERYAAKLAMREEA